MALPGGNYSAYSGLDLTLDPTVEEYVIDPTETAFRHWMTPVTATGRGSTGVSTYNVESNDCFTALSFKTSTIHTIDFNLTGSDELIWAANGRDYYVGYHGNARGRFAIHWPTGEVTVADSPHDVGSAETSAASVSSFTATIMLVTLAVSLAGIL